MYSTCDMYLVLSLVEKNMQKNNRNHFPIAVLYIDHHDLQSINDDIFYICYH